MLGINARGGQDGKRGRTAQEWSLASLSTYALGRGSPEHASPSASQVTTLSLHPKGKTHLPPPCFTGSNPISDVREDRKSRLVRHSAYVT